MTLRYPQDFDASNSPDYVQFRPLQYRANNATVAAQRGGGLGDMGVFGGGAPAAAGAQGVILYMPNSTPMVGNENNWGATSFAGPLGELKKLGGVGIVNTINKQSSLDPKELISNFTQELQTLKSGGAGLGGPAVKQFAMEMLPQNFFGASGAQFMAMSTGKTFNPNVELLYTAPGMRPFTFSFKFVPKSAVEAQIVNQIILNFKKWSAPKELENAMMEVPHVWQISYKTKGMDNTNMNRFKRAACTNVSVQSNPQTSMHVAHPDGMPVETVMSLSFREVDIITRDDHDAVQGQGF